MSALVSPVVKILVSLVVSVLSRLRADASSCIAHTRSVTEALATRLSLVMKPNYLLTNKDIVRLLSAISEK